MPAIHLDKGLGPQAPSDSISVVLASGAAGGGQVENIPYTIVASGEVSSGSVAAQLPSVACKLTWFRTRDTNTGTVYLGASGVTVPDGNTDTTSGLALIAGEQFGPIPIDNLNRIYHISSAQSQSLLYFTVR